MSFNTTSTPGGYSQGTQDNSRKSVTPTPLVESATMTLIPILARKGPPDATIVTGGAASLYGAESFTKDSKYYTHANKLLEVNSRVGIPSLVKRIIPQNATKSIFRLSAEVIPTDLPLYARNSDGSIQQQIDPTSGLSTPVSTGTIQGTRIVLHVGVGAYTGNAATFGQGTIVDNYRDGSTAVGTKTLGSITNSANAQEATKSRLIPLFDLQAPNEGEWGNDQGIRLSVPTLLQSDAPDASNIIFNKAFPLRVGLAARANATASASPLAALDGDMTKDLYLKSKAKDSISGNTLSFARLIVDAYSSPADANNAPVFGPFGQSYVYEKNINELQALLSTGYKYTDSKGGTVNVQGESTYDTQAAAFGRTSDYVFSNANNYGLLNFLTGKDVNGIPYYSLTVADSLLFGGVTIDGSTTFFADGGNDGLWNFADGTPAELVNLKLFDDAVNAYFSNFGLAGDPLRDILRYPFTNFIDSGYSMATKLTFANILKYRPDVDIRVGTVSVADVGLTVNDIGPVYQGTTVNATKALSSDLLGTWDFQGRLTNDQNMALATKLRTFFSMTPESTVFGTPIMRASIFEAAGDDVDGTYPHPLPMSFDRGLAINQYTSIAKFNASNDYSVGDNRKPIFLKNVQYSWRNDQAYAAAWNAGVNYLRAHDSFDVFFPGLQTVYPYKDSILASLKFSLAACRAQYVGQQVWRDFSGKNLTDVQFKQELESNGLARLKAYLTDEFVVQVNADLSAADKARGYSGSLNFNIGLGSMRTQLTYSVHGYTADELSGS